MQKSIHPSINPSSHSYVHTFRNREGCSCQFPSLTSNICIWLDHIPKWTKNWAQGFQEVHPNTTLEACIRRKNHATGKTRTGSTRNDTNSAFYNIAFSSFFVLLSIHSAVVAKHSFVEFDQHQTQKNVYGILLARRPAFNCIDFSILWRR